MGLKLTKKILTVSNCMIKKF